MSTWNTTARLTANLARFSLPKSANLTPQAANLVHRRGLAGGGSGGDHDGAPKVNFWQDPMNPSRWKEEHYAIVSITGAGLVFYGGYKYLTKDEKENKKEENFGSA